MAHQRMFDAVDGLEQMLGEHGQSRWQRWSTTDSAVLGVPAGCALATSIDTLVHGVHFTEAASPADIGYKALAVNLSDLAAVGATPTAALLSLSGTAIDRHWLDAFAQGFRTLADRFNVKLMGATLSDGPLAITVSVYGHVPAHQALRRDRAAVGDLIYVTGTLGDAGLALAVARGEVPGGTDDRHSRYLEIRLNRPQPRIGVGIALRNLASSAIDLSDGLLADLRHVLTASHVGATIDVTQLPLSQAMLARVDSHEARRLALCSGDDYELCFTVPCDQLDKLQRVEACGDCPIRHVGRIEHDSDLRCIEQGRSWPMTQLGYQHFV